MRLFRIEDNNSIMDDNSTTQLSHQNGGGGGISGSGSTGSGQTSSGIGGINSQLGQNNSIGGIGGMLSGGVGALIGHTNNSTGGSGSNSSGPNIKQGDEQPHTPESLQYSIPGILHFIQHEWARFELERSQWDVDRAELQAQIAILLGERKGQESLKSDLIRRIKMLEYALIQERAKFHRLKFGSDPPTMNDVRPPGDEPGGIVADVAPDSEIPFSSVSNITWRQGRQLLRQYLQEIGYTDTIIDVRSNRVRLLLGVNSDQEENVSPNINDNGSCISGGAGTSSGGGGGGGGGGGSGSVGGSGDSNTSSLIDANNKRANDLQSRGKSFKRNKSATFTEAMLLDSEAAVMANFEFLAQTDVEMSDEDDIVDDLDMVGDDTENELTKRKTKGILSKDVDAEAEEVLNELNLLTEGEDANITTNRNQLDEQYRQTIGYPNVDATRRSLIPNVDEEIDSSLRLGELAQLTVNNEAETTYDVSNTKEAYRKTWNAKYTLRSHFDGVRALAFHPQEPVLITASEDHTLKLWNLQKTVPAKKSASLDVEPLYTFRAHTTPVLCLAMSPNGEQCYSGDLMGGIQCWNLPNSNIEPYDSYDPNVMRTTVNDHKDAVWGLSVHHQKGHLVSCSADGTVKLWSPQGRDLPVLNTFTSDIEGIPSSVDFVQDEINRIVVAYNSAHCIIYDTQTGQQVVKLEAAQEMNGNIGKFINKVVSHPTLPITVTAHEDRHIRFWDNTTGSLIHSMVAHLEPVTSLAIDSHGLYLLSGSHDCSIRLWNFDNKTCVQEITAHRKKFDESIFDVAFHPTRPYIASAGADALAKVFV